jgi:alpha-L-rhamnosidase
MGLLTPDDWKSGWIAAETALLREDRLAGLRWMRGAEGTGNKDGRSFRLDFELPEAAELTIYHCANRPAEGMIDDSVLTIRHDAMRFGPQQTDRAVKQVQAGHRTLALFLKPDADAAPTAPAPHAAVLIRAKLASGKVLRFTSEQLRSMAGKPADWAGLVPICPHGPPPRPMRTARNSPAMAPSCCAAPSRRRAPSARRAFMWRRWGPMCPSSTGRRWAMRCLLRNGPISAGMCSIAPMT